jgi:ABC-type arginine transport system ATPase subunit
VGNEHAVTDLNLDNKADDTLVLVPAVGAGGRLPLIQGPLQPFLQ